MIFNTDVDNNGKIWHFSLVNKLANPPFGKKSSMTITNEEGEQERQDLSYNR